MTKQHKVLKMRSTHVDPSRTKQAKSRTIDRKRARREKVAA